MAGGKGKIHLHPKHNTNGLDKNPENINRKGAPKSFKTINSQLKGEGYEELTKSQLIEAYGLVFNSDEDKLKELAKDKNTPYALRIIIQELESTHYRAKALQDYRDYMFGKAIQKNETDVTVKDYTFTSNLED